MFVRHSIYNLSTHLKCYGHLGYGLHNRYGLSDLRKSRMDALIIKVRKSSDLLREYHMALISAAITGKIDVRKEAA